MFATASLARRIEQAESTLVAGGGAAAAARLGADRVMIAELGGGVAVFAGNGTPFSKVVGLGFAPLGADDLDRVEQEYRRHGADVRVELTTLADPAIGLQLSRRGYELAGFENVLATPIDVDSAAPLAAGISITQAGPEDIREWMNVVITGFLSPDVFDGPVTEESFPREELETVFDDMRRLPGFRQYLARRNGALAGGAAMRIAGGVAQLCGAATLVEHRHRGVQTALLHARLTDGRAAGCDLAVVTTQPGSRSQENIERFGFSLLYSRAVLIKRAALTLSAGIPS
jgi:GNAT superfamily N-acetyltransferase